MPMKNPPHPGRLVRDEIKALGLSVSKVAEGLGVTRQHLYRVLNGECGISPEMAIRLEGGIGSSASAWLQMQIAHDLSEIRKRASGIRVKRLAAIEPA